MRAKPKYVRTGKAAEMACVSKRTMQRIINKGEVEIVRPGVHPLVSVESLSAFLARKTEAVRVEVELPPTLHHL